MQCGRWVDDGQIGLLATQLPEALDVAAGRQRMKANETLVNDPGRLCPYTCTQVMSRGPGRAGGPLPRTPHLADRNSNRRHRCEGSRASISDLWWGMITHTDQRVRSRQKIPGSCTQNAGHHTGSGGRQSKPYWPLAIRTRLCSQRFPERGLWVRGHPRGQSGSRYG